MVISWVTGMDCLHTIIITDETMGEDVCKLCGIVVQDKKIDTTNSSEITYTLDDYNMIKHNGPPASSAMYDGGLSTKMNAQNMDSSFHNIPYKNKHLFNRLRLLDKRSKPKKTYSLARGLLLLNKIKTDLNIPDSVAEHIAVLYRKAVASKVNKGKQVDALLLACIYVTCRTNGIPRSISDISSVGNVKRKILAKTIRSVMSDMNIKINEYDVSLFINRAVNVMDLGEKIKRSALDLLAAAKNKMITSGKQPLAQAASCVYLACLLNNHKVTQRSVAKTCGVSEVTLRNRVKLLREKLNV